MKHLPKKTLVFLLWLMLPALVLLPVAGAGALEKPGSAADPVMTKSYLDNFLGIFFGEKMQQIEAIKGQLKEVEQSLVLLKELWSVPVFPDVQEHWARQSIMDLYRKGIVGGYADGNFYPDQTVTRAHLTVMLVRAKQAERVDLATAFNPFSDLSPEHWAYQDILTAWELGLIGGYPDGTFKPDREITRAEIATIIDRTFLLEQVQDSMPFDDVPADYWNWAVEHIDSLVRAGIVSGYGDGTFRPANQATRAEVATFMARALKFNFR